MGIVSSKIMKIWPQKYGSVDYWERHIDHIGGIHDCFWTSNSALTQEQIDARVQARIPIIEASLVESEVEKVRGLIQAETITPEQVQNDEHPLNFATKLQVARAVFKFFVKEGIYEVRKIISWLNNLTDTQMKNMFNLTQAQVNKVRTRIAAIIANNDFLNSDAALVKELSEVE